MKIAINGLSAKIGGGVTYLNEVCTQVCMQEVGHTYILFVRSDKRDEIVSYECDKLQVVEVDVKNIAHRFLYEQLVLPYIIAKEDVDVLYSPAEITTFLTTCPVILGVQNYNIYHEEVEFSDPITSLKIKIMEKLACLSAKKASKVVFTSNTAKDHIGDKLSIGELKRETIYHGVNLEDFKPNQDKSRNIRRGKYILCVSDTSKHKNIETLVEAYTSLDKELKNNYDLVIVGKKREHYYNNIEPILDENNFVGEIDFVGRVDFNSVAQYYYNASLFVLPSRLETFGMTLLEAMASETPVIASNATAIPEIVDEAGLLFDPDSVSELSDKMSLVLTEPNLRNDLIQKGKKRSKEFTWEKSVSRLISVFHNATNYNKDNYF